MLFLLKIKWLVSTWTETQAWNGLVMALNKGSITMPSDSILIRILPSWMWKHCRDPWYNQIYFSFKTNRSVYNFDILFGYNHPSGSQLPVKSHLFQENVPFLYPLKTSEIWFSGVLKGYRKRTLLSLRLLC